MTFSIALLLVILVTGLVLFSIEVIPVEVVALGMVILMVITGLLPAETAFDGFGSETVIMMLGLLIMTAALSHTGLADWAGRLILRGEKWKTSRIVLQVMTATALLSSFISNTASTVFSLPIVVGMARRARFSPSQLLMPLAFASILASSVTLIGTSTNIIVSGLMTGYGMAPLGMFEMAPVGLVIVVAGIIYMVLLGRHLVPDRVPRDEVIEGLAGQIYFTELSVPEGSSLIGKTLDESGFGRDLDLVVLRIIRDQRRRHIPGSADVLAEGDTLIVKGERERLLTLRDNRDFRVKTAQHLDEFADNPAGVELAEVLLMPGSALIGRTLRGQRFRERYSLQVLAIDRHGQNIERTLSRVRLGVGDVLLVQGPPESIRALGSDNTFRVLGMVEPPPVGARDRRWIAAAIFAGAFIAGTVGIVSLPIAMIAGGFLVFITRCMTPAEAYKMIQWPVLILIACMLAVGAAMESTGAARFLAAGLVGLAQDADPLWLLAGFFALTVLLTQPMSNQAAAVVVFPIAIQTALQLGLNPRTFAVMIAVAASTSFITPLEPACLLVYGPGHYRFFDFVKVGSLLTVIIFVIAILLVPMIWPL
jgi:di/tricarboxylate transporter